MDKPSLTLRLIARALQIQPAEALQGKDGAAEFLRWIARTLDIELTRRCEICGYEMDIWTWQNHMTGLVSCSGLRAEVERLRAHVGKLESETDKWATDLGRQVNQAALLDREIGASHEVLTTAGVPFEVNRKSIDLPERIRIAIAQSVERDFAWAMEQVHAGKAVTHPCLTMPNDKRGHIRQIGTLNQDDASSPVYELVKGCLTWSPVMPDSSTWRDLVHQAQKTHDWEIVTDEPAEAA